MQEAEEGRKLPNPTLWLARKANPIPQCDLQQPSCGQCMTSGLQCGGYDRLRIFISHTVTTKRVAPTCNTLIPQRAQIILPDALTRSAYESKTFGLFWEAYLPRGKPFSPVDAQFAIGSWLSIVDSSYHREDALKHALLALSLGAVGRQQGEVIRLPTDTPSTVGLRAMIPGTRDASHPDLKSSFRLIA